MHQAVIVDFDGTILDSYQLAFTHLAQLARQNGFSITSAMREKMENTWGCSGVAFLQNAFEVTPECARRLYREWEAMDKVKPIPLVDGARETLDWLHGKGIVVCMLTSRHKATVTQILARERLQNYFARITAYEDSSYSKPDGRAFTGILQTLARQKVSRKECIFVGDTFVDIEAGQDAGIETVVVETGPYRGIHDKTHPVPKSHVIGSIKDLPSWMEAPR